MHLMSHFRMAVCLGLSLVLPVLDLPAQQTPARPCVLQAFEVRTSATPEIKWPDEVAKWIGEKVMVLASGDYAVGIQRANGTDLTAEVAK